MERTYNVFIDNGLFVAANLLSKKIEELTIEDLKNNTQVFTDKIFGFITCDKYNSIKDMSFHNSAFNNPSFSKNRKEKIKEQLDVIIDNVGNDDYCYICGQKHINSNPSKDFLSKLNRAFIINSTADTFYNHSNNLQTVNVCPVCILLGMLSTLNMRKSGYLVLYNSEDADFMYDLTNRRQMENLQDIEKAAIVKDKNTINLQEEILFFIKEKMLWNNNLKVYKINNGKGEFYQEEFLSERDLNLLHDLYVDELLVEFNSFGLFSNMLSGNLSTTYMNKLIDFDKCELRCSKELIDFMERGLSKMDKELSEVIKKVSSSIAGLDAKKCLMDMKSISNPNKFAQLLLDWTEEYKDKKGEILMTSEEFDMLTDRLKYITIKNKMTFELIVNK